MKASKANVGKIPLDYNLLLFFLNYIFPPSVNKLKSNSLKQNEPKPKTLDS